MVCSSLVLCMNKIKKQQSNYIIKLILKIKKNLLLLWTKYEFIFYIGGHLYFSIKAKWSSHLQSHLREKMRNSIIFWFIITILIFKFNNFSQARNIKNLNYVVVVGSVFCDTCIQEDYSKASHFISG